MPMDDWSPGIFDHFCPMFFLEFFPTVTKSNFSDGIWTADPIVIENSELKSHLAQHTWREWTIKWRNFPPQPPFRGCVVICIQGFISWFVKNKIFCSYTVYDIHFLRPGQLGRGGSRLCDISKALVIVDRDLFFAIEIAIGDRHLVKRSLDDRDREIQWSRSKKRDRDLFSFFSAINLLQVKNFKNARA